MPTTRLFIGSLDDSSGEYARIKGSVLIVYFSSHSKENSDWKASAAKLDKLPFSKNASTAPTFRDSGDIPPYKERDKNSKISTPIFFIFRFSTFSIVLSTSKICYVQNMKRNEMLEVLNAGFSHSIKDPLWQNIPFTKELKELMEVRDVQKLARIKQNGPSYHIYPGAVHTRLNHSIGVYYLGREILLSLAKKSEDLPFSKVGILSFLCSCLLHDIGHFPYAHSLKELAIREHEEIAASMITAEGELKNAVINTGADPEIVAGIIDKDMLTSNEETLIYRSILSGTLDPDKLDYLSRDGFFAGIPYGKQDTDYIISALTFKDGHICLQSEAIGSVEQVLFSKYMMYKSLYWHKGVRSATAMIKKALITAIEEKTIRYNDLYFIDDYEFALLCKSRVKESEALKLVEKVERNELFERLAKKDYDPDGRIERKGNTPLKRTALEMEVFESLREKYPSLKPYEVIIDLPEPISFETHIKLIEPDGSIHDIDPDKMIFSYGISTHFQKNLRKVSLFLPGFVGKEDAEEAFQEVISG